MISVIGWIGSILLALCGLPQAYYCWKNKNANGVNGLFLAMWSIGEVFGAIYVLSLGDAPLITNYLINLFSCAVIVRYKIWPEDYNDRS